MNKPVSHFRGVIDSIDPDQTPQCATSDLGQHSICLPVPHKKGASFMCVNALLI